MKLNKTPLAAAVALVMGTACTVPLASAQQGTAAQASDQRIELTGSRLRRTETEGALPVTVIDRAAIEATGQTSVAELMREVTFASFGNTKPQSGNSAQALSDIDLRGLGSNRTLVLVDGRRISKAPFTGSAQDLNAIPLAAVERIEILSDGASAVYGSDAIGGVVNIITRRNFNGMQISYGEGNPNIVGGDTKEFSALWGASSSKGRVFAGVSSNSRAMIFTRDQKGGDVLGVSSFGNNYYRASTTTGGPTGGGTPVPGFACNDNNFYFTNPGQPGNLCSFNFNATAANEAAVGNRSIFAKGDFNVNDDWSVYTSASVSNVDSFGRYAATPVNVFLAPTSAPYLSITAATPGLAAASPRGLWLRHRMAAAGPRDTSTESTVSSGLIGVKGRVFGQVELDVGVRNERYKYIELGQNYIVRPLLESAITAGRYNIFNPFGNPADVLNGVKSTISRNDLWDQREMYGTASMDLFKIGSRMATGLVGVESRKEFYSDQYDPQSEAGIIEGSAGNSAAGSRKVNSQFFELSIPAMQNMELSFAGRRDSYSDSGSAFSPKAAIRWQPVKNTTVRASIGKGFRAPTLDILTQKPAFSADSVTDLRTCRAFGRTAAQCGDANGDGVVDGVQPQIQVDATVISNPGLQAETSKQSSVGLVLDATNWLSLSADYYRIHIDGRIVSISSQTLINRTLNPALGPVPAAFKVVRDPVTGQITNVTRGAINEGTLDTDGIDLNARTNFKFSQSRLQQQLLVSLVRDYSIDGGENLVGTQGAPKWRMSFANTYTIGRFTTFLAVNRIAGQSEQTAQPTSAYLTLTGSVTYTASTKTRLTVGAVNLTNRYPQLISYGGRPWNFDLYDGLGRQVYLRVQQTL
jgi:iron complex outermembrane receptor protein